ncbi:hypothetical protein KCU86_g65, partial [Aureobasidium melanogenum]
LKRKLNCSQLISFAGNHKLSAEALYGGMGFAEAGCGMSVRQRCIEAPQRRTRTVRAKVRFSSLKLASVRQKLGLAEKLESTK